MMQEKHLVVVSLDLPTSHIALTASAGDEFTQAMLAQWERSCKMRHLTSSTEEVMKWLSSDVFTQRLLCFCTDLVHTTFT